MRFFIDNMEKVITYTIEKEDGLKIESVLKNTLNLSATLIAILKRQDGAITLNGESSKVIERVKKGDILEVTVSENPSENIIPAKIPLDIIYEDGDILAVNKPHSMPTHPSKGHSDDTLANGVIHYLGSGKFHVITRLDRDTSGVVLIAKNSVSAAYLTEEMKQGRIQKEYIALINGVLNPKNGKIDAPIKKESEKGIKRCISPDGKYALTEYKTLDVKEDFSLVGLYPITGRTHQLRVHMSYKNCPIFGDELYAAPQIGERTRLHCCKITFTHPETKKLITITAPIPDNIKTV